MDGIHDMGGMQGFGPVPVELTGHGPAWGTRLQVVALLGAASLRAGIEALPPATYLTSGYHEKWLLAGENLAQSMGRVDQADLDSWYDRLVEDPAEMPHATNPGGTASIENKVLTTPLFSEINDQPFEVGDRVRVKKMRFEPHHRCPRYVRGAVGLIERSLGADKIPHMPRDSDHAEAVYTVRFDSVELWGDRSADGEPGYELFIDLWQSYLEAA